MGRAIGAVIAGLLVCMVLLSGGLTIAYLAIGAERTFEPGTYDATTLWLVIMVVVGIAGALLGGLVCRLIARRMKPVHVLAVLYFALGMYGAVSSMNRPDPGLRAGDVSLQDSVNKTEEPTWFLFINPVLGYIGVLIGGGFKKEPPLTDTKVA